MWQSDVPHSDFNSEARQHLYTHDHVGWEAALDDPHVLVPEELIPDAMLGTTFEGLNRSPEPSPPRYDYFEPAASDAAGVTSFGPPPESNPHAYADSLSSEPAACDSHDNEEAADTAQHRHRRKWSSSKDESAPGSGKATVAAPWYNEDSDVEDETDNADDSGLSAPVSSMGGDQGHGIDKAYLFLPTKYGYDETEQARHIAPPGSTQADALLQRYDSFKVD